MLYDPAYMRYLEWEIMETGGRMKMTRNREEGGMGSYYSMNTKFLFGTMKKFWKCRVAKLHNIMNILNAT